MIQQLQEKKYKIVDAKEKADIYIINTCTVTNMSDRKSRHMLRQVKERNPQAILVVCGCYVQVAKKELEAMPEIDIILGNNEKRDIVKWIENYSRIQEENTSIQDVMQQKEFVDFGNVTYTDKTRAVIKVQDGCDRFCSYCIIPYARGRVRSRKKEKVIEEIQNIAKNNIKEVVLTGIHIASYGKDLKENYQLIDLLEEINQIEGIERIRLGSIEPLLITQEFVKRLSKLEKICHHFHLSLQSGCDETLQRMNRKYTTEQFAQIVQRLRKAYEDVILTTDIIVGFPGETEEEFQTTYEFLQKIAFYKMHVFKYSPRKGTKAAIMPEQVGGKEKETRSQKLIGLSGQMQKQYHQSYVGNAIEILFEEEKGGYYIGHSKNYIQAYCKTKQNLANQIVKCTVIRAEEGQVIVQI